MKPMIDGLNRLAAEKRAEKAAANNPRQAA